MRPSRGREERTSRPCVGRGTGISDGNAQHGNQEQIVKGKTSIRGQVTKKYDISRATALGEVEGWTGWCENVLSAVGVWIYRRFLVSSFKLGEGCEIAELGSS